MMRRLLVMVPLLVAAVVWATSTRAGAQGEPAVLAQPMLGVADAQTVLMGAAGEDTWAYRVLPAHLGGKLAVLRHTDAAGWRVAETLEVAEPNRASARVTSGGGVLLVARGTGGPAVLVRKPGGEFHAAAPVPAGLLRPAAATPAGGGGATASGDVTTAGGGAAGEGGTTTTDGVVTGGGATTDIVATATPGDGSLDPAATTTPTPTATATPTPPAADRAETLVDDSGAGRVVAAAYEAGGELHALFAPRGRRVQDTVLHYDDGAKTWTREDVPVPGNTFEILALDAAGTDAWLLGTDGSALTLFQRVDARWEPRSLTLPITVTPLPASADPLTVTPDGVWVDAARSAPTDATFFRSDDGILSFCDDVACNRPFGARFSRAQGYRSFGFAGGGRVISNPLPSGGVDEDNRGTYLAKTGDTFERRPGGGGSYRASAAFSSPARGWLEGPVQIGTAPRPDRLRAWPAAARAPITAAVSAPGQGAGAMESAALAVGQEGTVLRYAPGGGWTREFLLSSSGAVSKPLLRGVAWPEPGRAHAVGDFGTMWLWRAETGLWERDPAAPVGFERNLMGIAFEPGEPLRGYAVGKEGALLRYDKSWLQETLPEGFADRHFTGIAFAGREALVAAGEDLLVNDGSGWRPDAAVKTLLGGARIVVVAGLPDGGAVAAGPEVVIERDGPGAPWRRATQPLLGLTPVAVAAYRLNGAVRALAAVQPQLPYPVPDVLPEVAPDSPPPLIPPFPLPADGYLVRETEDGWRDEQRSSYAGASADRPLKTDPIGALLVDAGGEGWALGGWSGESDAAGRGNGNRSGQGGTDRARVQTTGVYRYATGEQPAQPPALTHTGTNLDAAVVRFAVGGHAACAAACADLRDGSLGPDRTLKAAKDLVATLAAQSGGPRMFLYTGGRLPSEQPLDTREAKRFADLLLPGAPAYAAPSAADTAEGAATADDTPRSNGESVAAFTAAFTGAPAPFGGGVPPQGVAPVTGATPARPGARTHYAFDSLGNGGTVRVIVIDNSRGSLEASDPHQNPPEPQLPWLIKTLDEAKAQQIPAIVMGSRDLNSRFAPALNVATDGDAVAQTLVDHGASAYLFERPEENRTYPIPSGAPHTIPAFGTGTLGYRSALANTTTGPDAVFGDAGLLLAEVDVAKRDATTNRAPVSVRLLPVIDELTLQAVDGTTLRRSRPSLFQGLGRRPEGGDRWGASVGGGDPQPPGSDPYTSIPPQPCAAATCTTRVAPEFEFTSSAPDIGDFVAQDPASTNLRKPLIGPDDKVVSDHRSGLFCPFNAGKTTITVKTGGLAYSAVITVLAGSVQRPCGTRPLDPERFTKPGAATPPTSPPPPASVPPESALDLVPPVPPPPAARRERPQREPRPQTPEPPLPDPVLPPEEPVPQQRNTAAAAPPTTPPPPASSFARPIPPGGAVIRVFEEKREEEAAPESSSAAVAYRVSDYAPTSTFLYGLIVLAAFAGATLRIGLRRRERGITAASIHVPPSEPYRRRRP